MGFIAIALWCICTACASSSSWNPREPLLLRLESGTDFRWQVVLDRQPVQIIKIKQLAVILESLLYL